MSKETGGPAFPAEAKLNRVNGEAWSYQTRDGDIFQFTGMTLRDYFAAKAINGILSDPDVKLFDDDLRHWAGIAYRAADAMLAARNATE